MKGSINNEVIVVRSLTDSDLGLFAAHRPKIASKQRALNINASIAQRLLSPTIIEKGEAHIECQVVFGKFVNNSIRHFGKVGKNWRLGGNKLEGKSFSALDSRDFALIRSVESNDGLTPITILFISRANEKSTHAKIVRLIEPTIKNSMEIFREGSAGFQELAMMFPVQNSTAAEENNYTALASSKEKPKIPLMPPDSISEKKTKTIKEKIHSPHLLEQMLKISSDLSAPAQVSFLENVEMLASQLRTILLANGRIISFQKDHERMWKSVANKSIAFVDGGLANLSMLGSAPIAARVGGYVVKPGNTSSEREKFIVLKKLINELYSSSNGGVYDGSFPDISALRDAARISIEIAGAVHLVKEEPLIEYLFIHGALVNPVSRYTDIMVEGRPRYHFPNFSSEALTELLPGVEPLLEGKASNFINVYLEQLKRLMSSSTIVCGVVEREATTSSVIKALLESFDDDMIASLLPLPPKEWKKWFRDIIDPTNEDDVLGQRITDSLLFRCVLEPGEALLPVTIVRNELRRAPELWKDIISQYPEPMVSYLQSNEWSSPIRLEIFKKDLNKFEQIADLVLHCSLLLPRYSFPVGLDIVDKFAKIPNWMSKPINTNTTVQALKQSLYSGDEKLFDSLRRILCGSSREWLLRPSAIK